MDKKYPIPKKHQHKIAAIISEPPDGYFLYTRNGWCAGDPGLHCIAEDTLAGINGQIGQVIPCSCPDCSAGTMSWGKL